MCDRRTTVHLTLEHVVVCFLTQDLYGQWQRIRTILIKHLFINIFSTR